MNQLAFIPTMQPTLVDEVPGGSDWIHEIKYDGYRTQLVIDNERVRAFTRNGNDWTSKYGPIVEDARALECRSAILDGEIAVQDDHGVTDYPALLRSIASAPHRLVFFAFDLLHLDGEDLRQAPLEERRARLRWLLRQPPGQIRMSDEYTGEGAAFFAIADRLGLEGVVSKRKGSRYTSGASRAWLKIKCWHTDTFEVIGIQRDREGIPYALLANEGEYRGTAMISLPNALRSAFWRLVDEHTTPSPPNGFRRSGVTWVQPGMRATVRHLKGAGKLRHASVKDVLVEQ
jgi:ATP-dependent DNA ligase